MYMYIILLILAIIVIIAKSIFGVIDAEKDDVLGKTISIMGVFLIYPLIRCESWICIGLATLEILAALLIIMYIIISKPDNTSKQILGVAISTVCAASFIAVPLIREDINTEKVNSCKTVLIEDARLIGDKFSINYGDVIIDDISKCTVTDGNTLRAISKGDSIRVLDGCWYTGLSEEIEVITPSGVHHKIL